MRLIKGRTFYKEPWYNSYVCMMRRCYCEKSANYPYYGGRGIKVCDEWHDIKQFEAWVAEHPYFNGATIDRVDTNGDYEPSNCKWSTMFEQCKNRRNSIIIEHNGERHNITEWAKITGIKRGTLNTRYWRGDRGDDLFRDKDNRKGNTWVKKGGKRKWIVS